MGKGLGSKYLFAWISYPNKTYRFWRRICNFFNKKNKKQQQQKIISRTQNQLQKKLQNLVILLAKTRYSQKVKHHFTHKKLRKVMLNLLGLVAKKIRAIRP